MKIKLTLDFDSMLCQMNIEGFEEEYRDCYSQNFGEVCIKSYSAPEISENILFIWGERDEDDMEWFSIEQEEVASFLLGLYRSCNESKNKN